jgi:hypothetical protein
LIGGLNLIADDGSPYPAKGTADRCACCRIPRRMTDERTDAGAERCAAERPGLALRRPAGGARCQPHRAYDSHRRHTHPSHELLPRLTQTDGRN